MKKIVDICLAGGRPGAGLHRLRPAASSETEGDRLAQIKEKGCIELCTEPVLRPL